MEKLKFCASHNSYRCVVCLFGNAYRFWGNRCLFASSVRLAVLTMASQRIRCCLCGCMNERRDAFTIVLTLACSHDFFPDDGLQVWIKKSAANHYQRRKSSSVCRIQTRQARWNAHIFVFLFFIRWTEYRRIANMLRKYVDNKKHEKKSSKKELNKLQFTL